MEEYKPVHITEFKDTHEVSNMGHVRNKLTDHISTSKSLRSGYKSVWLSNKEHQKEC